jgi:hypothetical protein
MLIWMVSAKIVRLEKEIRVGKNSKPKIISIKLFK